MKKIKKQFCSAGHRHKAATTTNVKPYAALHWVGVRLERQEMAEYYASDPGPGYSITKTSNNGTALDVVPIVILPNLNDKTHTCGGDFKILVLTK